MLILTATFIGLYMVSRRTREDLCDLVPMAAGAWILLLYVLAFFRAMPAANLAAALILIWAVATLIRAGEERRAVLGAFAKRMLRPSVLVFLLCLAAMTLLVKDRVFYWWDDINFWATDGKAIYELNGFPGLYGNAAPEFGDYPPAISLFKWIFLHLAPGQYVEGLQFAGYYALNLCFLTPLLKPLTEKRRIAGVVLLYLIPGIVNGVCFYGTCADLTMGLVYGYLLCAILDKGEEHSNLFYEVRFAMGLAVLLLTKSMAPEWALFAVLFRLLFGRRNLRGIVCSLVLPACTWGSWMLLCLTHRRVAKLTGAGIRMAAHPSLPEDSLIKLRNFVLGFLTVPMHSDENFLTFDPSCAAWIILAFLLIILVRTLAGEGSRKLLLFFLLTGVLAYGLILLAHLSIFKTEAQYLEVYAMGLSVGRYSLPFTTGLLYVTLMLLLRQGQKSYSLQVLAMVVILLLTDWTGLYQGTIGYRTEREQRLQEREDMLDAGALEFLDVIARRQDLWGKRVLFLRDDRTIHWVHDTYVNYEASPVAVVYAGLNPETQTVEDTERLIRESHASYLYAEPLSEDSSQLFSNMLSQDGWNYGKIYRIETDQQTGAIRLTAE